MIEIVKKFLEEEKFKYEVDDDNQIITLFLSGNTGSWMGLANVNQENNQLIFYSVIPSRVPKESRAPVMEFITRANYNLLIGNFEMDMEDGEVRFKTSIDVSGDNLSIALVKNMIYFNFIAIDRHLESLMKVMYGNMSAKKAFEEAVEKMKHIEA
ncbi:MAG: YbjN domain-containing protein [Candidatus Eremiobacteraeota bacterium]|nr:YbjN domain-containing protein [Candidatus Eremiobacteraeota bacterium]